MVGRIEVKGDRAKGTLTLTKFWTEDARLRTKQRTDKLEAELKRLAKLAGLREVIWALE